MSGGVDAADASDEPRRDEGTSYAVDELELALERGEVTFPLLMRAYYLQSAKPEWLGKRYRELYRPALSQFMAAHDGISESFHANEFDASVLLTGTNELFANIWWDDFNFDTTPARAVEAEINDLRVKADLYLSENHRRICMQRLMRLYKGLLSSLKDEYYRWQRVVPGEDRAPHSGHIADLKQIRLELDDVQSAYRRAGGARGEARYIVGATLGAVAIVAMTGATAAVVGRIEHTIWLGAVGGGAIGALLSVLERLTRRRLSVRFESDRLAIAISGISRPVVGAISGVALFGLVEGNIVPLDVPASATGRGLFFASVAFLAGFSERLAKDVFGNAASALSGVRQELASANDSAKRSLEDAEGAEGVRVMSASRARGVMSLDTGKEGAVAGSGAPSATRPGGGLTLPGVSVQTRAPRAREAVVPEEKLVRYALDPAHRHGCHKARVFSSALGIERTDWRYLRDQLIEGVAEAPVLGMRITPFGVLYEVVVLADGLNGATAPVAVIWIIEDDGPPRLVSTWVDIP